MLKGFFQKHSTTFSYTYTIVVISIEKVDLLNESLWVTSPNKVIPALLVPSLLPVIFWIHARQNIPCVIKASSFRFIDPDQALLSLVFPHADRAIFAAGDEGTVQGVQIEMRDLVCVPDEGAEDVVVVERPIHYTN